MKQRRRGAALSFALSCTLVFASIGLGLWYLVMLLGGGKEVQHATDSGNLNVAKQALIQPSVDLNSGVERNNFGQFVDAVNDKIDLSVYNRVVGAATLIALNAEAQNTTESKQRAAAIVKAANDIGVRLALKLSDQALVDPPFGSCAGANSCRMLGATSQISTTGKDFGISYMERPNGTAGSGATNVYIDPNEYPSDEDGNKHKLSGSSLTTINGKSFLVGYQNPATDEHTVLQLSGVPLSPGSQPHLVSKSNFDVDHNLPKLVGVSKIPPNAFQSGGVAKGNNGLAVQAISCAITAAATRTFAASFPEGYIIIYNPAGIGGQLTSVSVQNVFNNELMNGGIYVADNNAFSTEYDSLKAWADYNKAVADGTATGNPPSSQGIFDSSGRQAATNTLTKITRVNPVPCLNTSVSGSGACAPCVDLAKGAFQTAYPATEDVPGNHTQLMAVEKFKTDVINAYFTSWSHDGGCRTVPVTPAITGLRSFDHNGVYTVGMAGLPGSPVKPPPGTAIFTVPGSVAQLLAQIGHGAPKIIVKLKERMRQMDPSASDKRINELLGITPGPKTQYLELDEVAYIYKHPLSGLTISNAAPPGVTPPNPRHYSNPLGLLQDSSILDGKIASYRSAYSTINKTVNPPHELNIHDQLWTEAPAAPGPGRPAPSVNSVGLGIDTAYFRPSSGFNSGTGTLLGLLEFTNQAKGDVTFCAPN